LQVNSGYLRDERTLNIYRVSGVRPNGEVVGPVQYTAEQLQLYASGEHKGLSRRVSL
jgi:hypothetical protein